MNNITLAHIGGELVLVGGLAFYFHRKNNMMMKEIAQLKQQNQQLHETIMELQENVQQIGGAMMQMQQMGGQMSVMNQQMPQTKRHPMQTQQSQARRPIQQRVVQKHKTEIEKSKKKKKIMSDSDDSGDETYDDKELDKELSKEYTTLAKEREKCDGERCELIE